MFFKSYNKTTISKADYARALMILVNVAQNAQGSMRKAAAQVLLSTYNGFAFKMDLTDLCYLEGQSYDAAISVIRGRAETLYEPQEMIENGRSFFRDLCEEWKDTDIFYVNHPNDHT